MTVVSESEQFRITVESPGLEPAVCTALMVSLDAGGIVRLKVPSKLTEGTRVRLHASSAQECAATVLYSVGSNNEYWATIQVHQEGRRREPRIPVNTEATIRVLNSDMAVPAAARVTDVSDSGLGLVSNECVPPNAYLKISLPTAVVFAEARHCRAADSNGLYHLGVEIQAVILNGEPEPDWMHTPKELWGELLLAGRQFQNGFLAQQSPPLDSN